MSRPAVPGTPGRSQRGSGTVLGIAVLLVVAVLTGALLVIVGYVSAVHHLRAAADLVALSGAAGRSRGQDACRVAAGIATANQVRLVACREVGDSLDFVVTVTVGQEVRAPSPLLPAHVAASAAAGRLGLLR